MIKIKQPMLLDFDFLQEEASIIHRILKIGCHHKKKFKIQIRV